MSDEKLGSPLGRPIVRRADKVFERLSPYPGNAFRNHCFRQYEFARQLSVCADVAFDWDTLYAIALVRPLGAFESQGTSESQGTFAARDAVGLFEREFRPVGLVREWDVVHACLRLGWAPVPTADVLPMVELFRQAIWIERSLGTRRYLLSKQAVREVFEAYPRDNLDATLLDFFTRARRVAF